MKRVGVWEVEVNALVYTVVADDMRAAVSLAERAYKKDHHDVRHEEVANLAKRTAEAWMED